MDDIKAVVERVDMTDLDRAVERLREAADAQPGVHAGYSGSGWIVVVQGDLRTLLDALRERGEALASIADQGSPFDFTGEPLHVRISKDLSRRVEIARAALTGSPEIANANHEGQSQ